MECDTFQLFFRFRMALNTNRLTFFSSYFWKTFTAEVAVELAVFGYLPCGVGRCPRFASIAGGIFK